MDTSALADMVRERRGRQSLRQTAEDVGVSFSTLTRVENGAQPDLTSFTKICAWLGIAPTRFFTPVAERDIAPLERAISHLHQDPRLSKSAAASLAGMLTEMYNALVKDVPRAPRTALACHLRAATTLRPGVPERFGNLLADMHAALEEMEQAGRL